MEQKENGNREPTERELWLRFRTAIFSRSAPPSELDPNLLAAYLDGKASPKEIELVETAMLLDSDALETVAALRRSAKPKSGLFTVVMPLWWRVATAACLVAAISFGFHLGRLDGGSNAENGYVVSEEAANGTEKSLLRDPLSALTALASGDGQSFYGDSR